MGQKARCVMLWEHFYLLCGKEYVQALLLDRLIFLSQQKEQLIDLLAEEQAHGNLPLFTQQVKLDRLRGWIRKSADALAESLMCGVDGRTVQRHLDKLEQQRYLFKRVEKGKAAEYRPNLRFIEQELDKLGFTLDGNPTRQDEVVDVPPTQTDDQWWTETPGISKEDATGSLDKLKADDDWRVWANGKTHLRYAPDEICRISHLIFLETGFEPIDKTWLGAVQQLWYAAGQNEQTLRAALQRGQEVRMNPANNVTFGGPRAYMSYAKDAKARGYVLKNAVQARPQQEKQEVIRVGRNNSNYARVDSDRAGYDEIEDGSSGDYSP